MNSKKIPGPKTSEQEVFDFVVAHLLTQGCKSRAGRGGFRRLSEGGCAYRGESPDGAPAQCAAGCLIPEEEYHHSFEGRPVTHLPYFHGWRARDLVTQLQGVHDSTPVQDWPATLRSVARKFCLHYNPPKD